MQSAQTSPTLSVRRIAMTGVLAAISILLGLTRLGFIPVPNLSGNATIMHVPVIVGAVLEGPVVGTIIGLIFGVFSFFQATEIFFKDPLVSILPRLFIGIAAYTSYAALRHNNEYLALIVGSVVGSLTNTVLVVGMLILRGYFPVSIAWAVAPQAIVEAILAAVITVAVVAAWKNIDGGRRGSSV